jgi:hypothetical protein
MISALAKIEPGSIICDPNNTENFYRVIEHVTIFDGFDLGYGYGENDQFAYGETKRIARCKHLTDDKMYRFPVDRKFLYLEGPNGDKSHIVPRPCDGMGINGAGPIKGHWG